MFSDKGLCLLTFVLICWMVSDLAGILTTSCIASLKVKGFQTENGMFFCTQSLENLHWASHVTMGRGIRINR